MSGYEEIARQFTPSQKQLRGGAQRTQTIIVTDLICEGPIEGLVEGRASVFLNNDRMDTPAGGTRIYSTSDISSVSIQLTQGSSTGTLTNASLDMNTDGKRYLIIKKTHTQTVTAHFRRGASATGARGGLKINTDSNFFENSMITKPEEATSPATIIWARLIPLNENAKELAGDTEYYSGRIGKRVDATEAHWYPIDTGMEPFGKLQRRDITYEYTLEIDTPVEVTAISNLTVQLASIVSFGAANTATNYSFDDAGAVFDKVADLPATGQKVHSGQLQFRVGELHQKALIGEGGEGVNAIVSSPNVQIERSSSHLGVNYGGSQAPKVFIGTGTSGTGFGLTPAQVAELDEIKINISYGGGFKQVNSAGDDEYTYQDYKMFISTKVDGTFGDDELLRTLDHYGMYNDPVTWEHIVDMESYKPFDDFKITIVRKTAHDGDGYLSTINETTGLRDRWTNNINQTQAVVSNLVSIIKDSLSFPLTAVARVSYSTKSYQELPERRYHIRGLKVSVPSNYVTREEYGQALYTRNANGDVDPNGIYQDWDGTFRTQVYTNNPAWIFYDILTNNRYGLGTFLSADEVDKYALYRIARYCDELVPDGKGGTEPRYTCNVYIGKQTDAYKLLKDLTTNFVAMLYFLDGKVTPVQDVPASPSYTFNATNVINGEFNYESTGDKTQTNQIVVTWNNPENMYATEPLILEDRRNIAETGRIISRSAFAFGCTSEGQATRYGRWKLWTSINQKEIVSFQTGMTAAFLSPGDLVNIQDGARHGLRYGGRVSSTGTRTTTTVPLDSAVSLTSGSTYELTIVFVKPGAYLTGKDTVTINTDTYNSGDLIPQAYIYNSSNSVYELKDIETEEEAANAKESASSTKALLLDWKDTYRTESRDVTTSTGNNITSLSVSTGFSAVPLSEDVWGLKETSATAQVVHGSLKVYKVLGIAEDSKGNFDITAAEHYNEKFQSIDTDFNAYIADRIYPTVTYQSVVPPVICLYSKVPRYKQEKSVYIAWTPPAGSNITTTSQSGQEESNSTSSVYEHLLEFEIRHNLPLSEKYEASPIRVENGINNYEFTDVPAGNFTASILVKNTIGKLSERKDISILIENRQPNIVDSEEFMEQLPKGGTANSQTTISSIDRGHLTMTNFSAADTDRTQGIYSGVAGTSDGSGTVGTFNIQVSSSGAVVSAVAATFGFGHAVGDTITILDSALGGGDAENFTMDVNTVSVAGVFSFAGPRYNYKSPQQISEVYSNPSNGAAATFSQDCTTMTVSDGTGGVSVSNSSDYQNLWEHYYILFDKSNAADTLKLIKYTKTIDNQNSYWYDAGTGTSNGTGLVSKNGTITRTAFSSTIVGTGTAFLADFEQGALIELADNFSAKVTQVISNTKMLIDRYSEDNATDVTYKTNNCRIDYNNDSVIGKVYKDASGNYYLDSYVSYDTSSVLSALTVSGSTTDSEGNIVVTMSDNSQIIIPKGVNVKVVYADDANGTNKSFTRGSNQRFVLYFEYTGPTPELDDITGTWVNYIGELQGVIAIYADDASGTAKSFSPASKDFVNFLEWTVTKPDITDTRVTSLTAFVKFVGTDGANSRTVNLSTTKQVFAYDNAGSNPNPNTSTVTATAVNTVGTPYYQFFVNGSSVVNSTTNSYTYTPQSSFSNLPETIEVNLREGGTSTTVLASDIMTVYGIKATEDGQDAFTVVLSNEAHNIPAIDTGAPKTNGYANSGTDIKVFLGTTALSYGTGASTFSVTASGSGITPNASPSTVSTNTRRYGIASSMANTATSATITYSIEARNAAGVATTFTKVQSFTKGNDGTDGVTINVENESYTVPTKSEGAAVTNAFDESSAKITVSVGTQDCTYATSGALTFSVAISARTAVTDSGIITSSNSNKIVNIPVITSFSAVTGSRTFQITVRNADGDQIGVYNKTQTFSRSPAGENVVTFSLTRPNINLESSAAGVPTAAAYTQANTELSVLHGNTTLSFHPTAYSSGTTAQKLGKWSYSLVSATPSGLGNPTYQTIGNASSSGADFAALQWQASDFVNVSNYNTTSVMTFKYTLRIVAYSPTLDSSGNLVSLPTQDVSIVFSKTLDGSSNLQAELSNGNHTITANTDGTVPSGNFAGTGTELRVFEGDTALDFHNTGNSPGTFAIAVALTGVTQGASPSFAVSGSSPSRYASFADITAMSGDTGKIVFTITGKKADGNDFASFDIQQSFSKSKTGDEGDEGAEGDGGYSIILADPAVTIREKADGTYDFTGTTTNLKVFHQGTSIYATSMVSFVNNGTTDSTLLITARTITGSIPNNLNTQFAIQQDALGSVNGGVGTANADQSSGGSNPFFVGWDPITSWTAGGLTGTRTMKIRARSIVGGVTTDSNFTATQTITAIPYQPRSSATFTFDLSDSSFMTSQGNGAYSRTNNNFVSARSAAGASAYSVRWAGSLSNTVARGIIALVQNNSSDKCIVPGDVVEIIDTTDSANPEIATRIYRPTVNPPGTGHFGPASSYGSTTVPNFQSIPTSASATALWSSVVVKRFRGSVIVDDTLSANSLIANDTFTKNLNIGADGAITLTGQTGKIVQGKTTFGEDEVAGFFLGMDAGTAKFRIGNSDNTKGLSWDGSDLTVRGDLKGGTITSSDGAHDGASAGSGFFLGQNGAAYIGNTAGGHIKVGGAQGAIISAVSKEAVSGIGSELVLFGVQGVGSTGSLSGNSQEITIGTLPGGPNAFKPFASVHVSLNMAAACRVTGQLIMTAGGASVTNTSTITFTSVTAVNTPFGFLGNLGVVANLTSYNLMTSGDTITASGGRIATVGSKYDYNGTYFVWLTALSGIPAGVTTWSTQAFNTSAVIVCTETITVPSSSKQSLTLSGFLNQSTIEDTDIKLKLWHYNASGTSTTFPSGSTYINLYAYGEKVK